MLPLPLVPSQATIVKRSGAEDLTDGDIATDAAGRGGAGRNSDLEDGRRYRWRGSNAVDACQRDDDGFRAFRDVLQRDTPYGGIPYALEPANRAGAMLSVLALKPARALDVGVRLLRK